MQLKCIEAGIHPERMLLAENRRYALLHLQHIRLGHWVDDVFENFMFKIQWKDDEDRGDDGDKAAEG